MNTPAVIFCGIGRGQLQLCERFLLIKKDSHVLPSNCLRHSSRCFQKFTNIRMNSKHLATGAQCPPLVPGSLRIYSMRFCPYAQRALLAAAAKGIEYDVVNINLVHKPEFLFSKNKDGKVPTIEIDNEHLLFESLIVSDYIDEAESYNKPTPSGGDAPTRRLQSQNAFQKALDRIWIEKFSKVSSLDFQLYFQPNLSADEIRALIKLLNEELAVFENELKRRGTKYFGGSDKPGMLDYMIWPWMERLPSLELIHTSETSLFQEGKASLPLLAQWQLEMAQDDAVKESYLSPEIHAQYRNMRRTGSAVDYDFLQNE